MNTVNVFELAPALMLFCFAASITPGPNNILLTHSGTHFGVTKTLPHLLGIRAGMTIMHLAMLLGLGKLFLMQPKLHFFLQLCASGYILYLAYKVASSSQMKGENAQARPLNFYQGMLFQLINPKSYAVLMTLCTALTLPGSAYWPSAILGVVIFNLVAACSGLFWVNFGKYMRQFLNKPTTFKRFNWAMSLFLAASIPLVFLSNASIQ